MASKEMDPELMDKIGYVARMLKLMGYKGEIRDKLMDIMRSVTSEPYFRELTEEEKEFIRGLVKQYKEMYGVSIVDRMAEIYGVKARAYLRDFEVV